MGSSTYYDICIFTCTHTHIFTYTYHRFSFCTLFLFYISNSCVIYSVSANYTLSLSPDINSAISHRHLHVNATPAENMRDSPTPELHWNESWSHGRFLPQGDHDKGDKDSDFLSAQSTTGLSRSDANEGNFHHGLFDPLRVVARRAARETQRAVEVHPGERGAMSPKGNGLNHSSAVYSFQNITVMQGCCFQIISQLCWTVFGSVDLRF